MLRKHKRLLSFNFSKLNRSLLYNPPRNVSSLNAVAVLDDDIINNPEDNKLIQIVNKPIYIVEHPGNICNECKGVGWKTSNDFELDFGFNFKFVLCKKCKGTGLI